MKKIYLILILLFSLNVFSQNDKQMNIAGDNLLNGFIGTWKGEGKVMGLDSKIEMSWEKVLNGQYIKLTFRNRMLKKDGKTEIFEGHAYYKSSDKQKYQGTWFDSNGENHPIVASFENDFLVSIWGTENTKLGKTVYRLTARGKMEIVDSIKRKDGSWFEFGKTICEFQK